jgi:type VI protein secretion system component VasK
MPQPLAPQRATLALLVATILLPITICVILGVAALLNAMGDVAGGGVLQRVALACGIFWAIDLICLVLVLAIRAVRDHDEPDGS